VSFVRACALADLPEAEPTALVVDGVDVAVVRIGDEVFAIEDLCSHEEVPLSEGEVDDHTIECWQHGSRFDLRTGEPTGLPATEPVPVYPVKIAGEGPDATVYIDVQEPLN
jgi:3-phenylpropionate/trans-cinnamate dioxygenase ferredoxin subunit